MGVQIKGAAAAPAPAKPVQSIAEAAPVVKPQKAEPSELAETMKTIKKTLGEKSIVRGSEIPMPKRLPTGVFEFDLATGGGFPENRYSIVYGPESSGKTNIVYKAIAQAQRRPPPCNKAVFVDLEGTFSAEWAMMFGVDVDALIVAKPSYGEQAVDMIDALVRASDVAFLAVDSIAVMIAAREVAGSTEKADVGTSALLIKRLSNKLAIALSEEQKRDHNVAVVLLNQTRFKIGVMFGDPETMPGGQTVKFNASLIVRIYGKNETVKEISSNIPAFKETTMTIKKAKIGIVQAATKYSMCMLEHDGLSVGDTDSFNAVKGYLQASGHLKKVEGSKGGWELLGKVWPTLSVLQDTYRAENEFANQLHEIIVKSQSFTLVEAQSLVEPQGEQPVEGAPVG